MLQTIEQPKTTQWTRPAALPRSGDERPASWKVLLPYIDEARVLAVDVDAATSAALLRSFSVVDTVSRGGEYDIVVSAAAARLDHLAPGGIWVSLTGVAPSGLCDVRRYAMLPAEKPRIILPLGPRRARSSGLRFHRPTHPRARTLACIAAKLSDLGLSRHLGPPRVIIARKPGPTRSTTLAQWLAERIGRPIDDVIIYTGSDAPHRKITALAIGPRDTADIVVKLADTDAAARAIDRENDAIHTIAMSSLVGCAPRPICKGRWGSYTVAAQSILRGRASELTLTDAHLAWLGRMSRIERSTLPLSQTKLWSDAHVHRRDDVVGELADLDALNADMPVACHMTHGDFAPWNLQRRGELVLAVDWEDADLRGVACVDAFHFLFRTASCVGPWPGGAAMAAQLRFAGAQLAVAAQQINAALRLWLAHEAWTQPAARDHAVETLAQL